MGGGWVRVRVGDRYRGHPRTVIGNPGHISAYQSISFLELVLLMGERTN